MTGVCTYSGRTLMPRCSSQNPRARWHTTFVCSLLRYKETMEAKYTTNKSVIPDVLLDKMRDVFARSEGFLDQSDTADSVLVKNKRQSQTVLDAATPEQLGLVLDATGHRQNKGPSCNGQLVADTDKASVALYRDADS